MKKNILKDYEKWKKINQESDFSFFDYIYHITRETKISSDLFFAFLELFWPSFVVQGRYVFLKTNVSQDKVVGLEKQGSNVEYWINLFVVDPYFENDENKEEKAEFLAKSLIKLWKTKLSQDFPEKRFIVEYVFDSDCGDYGLTFFQQNNLSVEEK